MATQVGNNTIPPMERCCLCDSSTDDVFVDNVVEYCLYRVGGQHVDIRIRRRNEAENASLFIFLAADFIDGIVSRVFHMFCFN